MSILCNVSNDKNLKIRRYRNMVSFAYIYKRKERINMFESDTEWQLVEDCENYIVYYRKKEHFDEYGIYIKDMDHQLENIEYKGVNHMVGKDVQNFYYDGTIKTSIQISSKF